MINKEKRLKQVRKNFAGDLPSLSLLIYFMYM
jgi:hypothetical protein